MSQQELLSSWRPGPTRDALLGFLGSSTEIAAEDRLACFDNDGTLWCERPSYPQLDFFVAALGARAALDPSLRDVPAYAAVLGNDMHAAAEIGVAEVVTALVDLFTGDSPEQFHDEVRAFFSTARHPVLDRPSSEVRFQPMLELIDALRRHDFTVAIVSGGGVDFLRAVSEQLYGVAPELVVGSAVTYDIDTSSGISLVRTAVLDGSPNEGAVKVANIQRHLGRRPVFAAGNSAGDAEMLAWAASADHGLALLVDHDDPAREFAYASKGETVANDQPITEVAAANGWLVASIATDWAQVFPPA